MIDFKKLQRHFSYDIAALEILFEAIIYNKTFFFNAAFYIHFRTSSGTKWKGQLNVGI